MSARSTSCGLPLGRVRLRLVLCLVLAVAFGLRIYRLDAQSLWFDEGFALHLASQSARQIVDNNPVGWLPLHSFAFHAWSGVVGQTPFAARALSVFFGVLVVALLYLLGRTLATPETGVIAALIGTFSPFLVYYSQEARVYSLWLFLSLLSVYLLLRALRRPGQVEGWILYVLSTMAALYAHYFSVFLLPWGLVVVAVESVRRRHWKTLVVGAACQAAALASCAPLVGYVSSSSADRYGFWRSPLSPLQVMGDLWYHFTSGGNLTPAKALLGMGALAMGAIVGLFVLQPRRHAALLALYFAVPVVGMLILSRWRELYVARYLAIAAPAGYLLAAGGFGWLWSVIVRHGGLGRVLALVAVLCLVGGIAPCWAQALDNYYFSPEYARDDFRSAALFVGGNERDGDVVVMSGGGISTAFLPYYGGCLPWVDIPQFGEWLDEEQVVQALNGLLAGRAVGRVWLVLSGNEITDPQNLIVAHLWTYAQATEARSFAGRTGVRVLVFSPRHEGERFTFSPLAYEPLEANFDNQVELVGFEIDGRQFHPGDDIHLALKWRALSEPKEDYHAFAHLLAEGSRAVAGHDKVPLNEYFRPTVWPVGEPLRDEYIISIPRDLPPGRYGLEVGLYSYPGLQRLPVFGYPARGADRALLPPILVVE
ncbi:MAG: glycosyltransferase family 39 protein [Anaerolineae bacterium]